MVLARKRMKISPKHSYPYRSCQYLNKNLTVSQHKEKVQSNSMDSGRIQITISCSKNYTNKSSGGLEVTYETHLRKKSLSDDEVKRPLFPLRILCSLAQWKDFLVLIKNWTFSFFNPKLLAATIVIKLLSLLWPPFTK